MKKAIRIVVVTMLTVIILASCSFAAWSILGSYRADETAKVYLTGTDEVAVSEREFGWFFDGDGSDSAVVFYPGAFVDCEAYAPLMCALAQRGTDCFLLKMPLNFALLGSGAADKILSLSSEYTSLWLCGHSLGGTAASIYLADKADVFDGIIFLASYPSADLSGLDISALSIYGSEDGVLNMENLEQGMEKLPPHAERVCIEGGNHAFFGSYGQQRGDGAAYLTAEKQWAAAADIIERYIKA